MISPITRFSLIILFTVTAAAACSKKAADPKAIADKFWAATKSGDNEKIKPYVTKASLESDIMKEESGQVNDGEYTLGEAKIDGNTAKIPTTLSNEGMSFNLETILTKENDAWRVDVMQTMGSMMGGAMGEMVKGIEKMGEAFVEGFEQGMQDLGEEMPNQPQAAPAPMPAPAQPPAPMPGPSSAIPSLVGQSGYVEFNGQWYPATVMEEKDSQAGRVYRIKYTQSGLEEWVAMNRLSKDGATPPAVGTNPYAGAFQAGKKVSVEYNNQWYDAAMLEMANNQGINVYKIRYASGIEEWVAPNRMQELSGAAAQAAPAGFKAGDAVKVFWGSTWWDAHVIEAKADTWKVNYDGWDANWDEWVGADRIKHRQ